MIRTFHYVRHSELADWLRCGWLAHDSLNDTHHGQYSSLCEWICDCEMVRPISKRADAAHRGQP
jgi:hypothetical protein